MAVPAGEFCRHSDKAWHRVWVLCVCVLLSCIPQCCCRPDRHPLHSSEHTPGSRPALACRWGQTPYIHRLVHVTAAFGLVSFSAQKGPSEGCWERYRRWERMRWEEVVAVKDHFVYIKVVRLVLLRPWTATASYVTTEQDNMLREILSLKGKSTPAIEYCTPSETSPLSVSSVRSNFKNTRSWSIFTGWKVFCLWQLNCTWCVKSRPL